jgi:transcriptional regulator with XRE-family HTH domain
MSLLIPSTTAGAVDIADTEATLLGPWRLPAAEPSPPQVITFELPAWLGAMTPQRRIPSLREQLQAIKDRTGWSMRTLGAVTDTTHPTIEAILRGRTRLQRSPGTARRITDIYELTLRLWTVVGGDRATLDRALTETPGQTGSSATERLRAGDSAGAYLAALDVLQPPRAGGMMTGRYPARPGEATTAIYE